MLAVAVATLSFAPGMRLPQSPALAVHSPRSACMMFEPGTMQWLADAAPVLLPPDAGAAKAVAAAAEEPGLFDLIFVKPFESAIIALHGALQGAGIEQAYGPAIILFTLLLKLLTYPLNKQQIESTSKMQAIQPEAKRLQEKYRNADPARLNMELQKLYTTNEVNPLAGCLPALAQIPIFIGLYRSVLNLAKENKLEEGFLWLPSLEGPVADYTEGIGWLTGNQELGYAWSGTTPPLGWDNTLAYLVLPVLLVISQYISTSILTPKTDDPAQQQTQAILKVLPLMIGWFSLNVPSGLGLYWITNNVVTTASTLLIRQSVQPVTAGAAIDVAAPPVEPPKAQGFGRKYGEVIQKTDGDTKVTISPPGAKREDTGGAPVVEATVVGESTAGAVATAASIDGQPAGSSASTKKKRRKKKKKN